MKISREEAMYLIDSYCDDDPLPNALERAINHEWAYDPRNTWDESYPGNAAAV